MTQEVIDWIENTRKLNLNKGELSNHVSSGRTCNSISVFPFLTGSDFTEKVNNLWELFQSEKEEEMVLTENKSKLKVVIADNSESKEIIDFLSEMYDVEIIVNENPESNKSIISDLPDLIIFTGGEDVHPGFYDQNVGKFTVSNKERDKIESNAYYRYKLVPKLGIGRGAQFLTAIKGGSLIQHVTGHTEPHRIITSDGKTFDVISDHHQMMNPYHMREDTYEILAWSKQFRSSTYLNGENQEINLTKNFLEPEIVQYINHSLCFQVHPELSDNKSFRRKCLNYISNFLEKKSVTKKTEEDTYEFSMRSSERSLQFMQPINPGSYGRLSVSSPPSLLRKDVTLPEGRFSIGYDRTTGQEVDRLQVTDSRGNHVWAKVTTGNTSIEI